MKRIDKSDRTRQSKWLRAQRAKKSAEKRLRFAQNEKLALENSVSALEARLQCLADPAWVAEYIRKETEIAQGRISNLTADLSTVRNEIAGLQVEIARHNQVKKPEAA